MSSLRKVSWSSVVDGRGAIPPAPEPEKPVTEADYACRRAEPIGNGIIAEDLKNRDRAYHRERVGHESGDDMGTNRARFLSALISVSTMFIVVGAPSATADSGVNPPMDYGGGCVIDPANRSVTIDSLRSRCTLQQQNSIFGNAVRGAVPTGVKNGWVTSPATTQAIAPAFWIGKTFYTGQDGGYVLNRLTGAGFEGLRANVYSGPAITDGAPTWALDYLPPVAQTYDEIREITPGVWFGYSWQRDTAPPTLMLTFALA